MPFIAGINYAKVSPIHETPRFRIAQSLGLKCCSDMESGQFTLDEANALVPWLEETFQRLASGRQEHLALQERLTQLLRHRESNEPSNGNAELTQIREDVDRLARQLEDGVEEILDRGIIVRTVEQGLVDFPSQREGREVYLCWIRGEDQIEFWHETDRGFAHRQPL